MPGGHLYVRRIPERVIEGKPLGRHVRHDPRSLQYLVSEADVSTLTSVRHVRCVPVLDQGSLGSCTGNAAEGCLGTQPLWDTLPAGNAHPNTTDADLDERQAIALYSAATQLDGYDGAYPPIDTGSDGLSVAKACVNAGLISGYRHATSLTAALTALAQQPVITGVNWYSSFDQLLGEQGDVTVFVPVSQPAPTPTPTPSDPLNELAAMFRQWIAGVESWFKKHGL